MKLFTRQKKAYRIVNTDKVLLLQRGKNIRLGSLDQLGLKENEVMEGVKIGLNCYVYEDNVVRTGSGKYIGEREGLFIRTPDGLKDLQEVTI